MGRLRAQCRIAGRLRNTAHVYDGFAEKLTSFCHVYGITRRGFGASTHAESGYAEQRLSQDILVVLDSLKIASPVLMGHSAAGGEMMIRELKVFLADLP